MSKILIMVLSYNVSPYKELMEAQKSSWDSVEVEGVTTIYYYGGEEKQKTTHRNEWSMECGFDITDEYYKMAGKFQRCLQRVYDCGNEYSYIFRSNSSSFICKHRLKEFVETLPKEKLYAGWEFIDSEDFGGGCISGAGIWLSRDTAEILRKEIDPNKELEEDVYIGRILRKHGIEAIDDKSRLDLGESFSEVPIDLYHYRLKTGDRLRDAENMKVLHKLITE